MDATPNSSESRELLSSSEIFIQSMAELVDKNDVHAMVDDQRHMLMRFEKTNEMLLNFNVLSANRYSASVQEFKKHTQLLTDMKKDLDSIFRRIRNVKQTLSKQYPKAFNACGDVYNVLETTEEEDIVISIPVPVSPAHQAIEEETKTGEEPQERDVAGSAETSTVSSKGEGTTITKQDSGDLTSKTGVKMREKKIQKKESRKSGESESRKHSDTIGPPMLGIH